MTHLASNINRISLGFSSHRYSANHRLLSTYPLLPSDDKLY